MLPQIPQSVNKLLQDANGQPSTYPFPKNVAAQMPKSLRQKIYQWMLQTYIWPQIMERRPYEATWDKLLDMARATWKVSELSIDENTRQARINQTKILAKRIDGVTDQNGDIGIERKIEVADTVIFDAIDRLTNLNHFITFKESFPVRYELPPELTLPNENDVYSPSAALVKSANAWLKFNATNANVYRKGWMTARHHYTYGVSFVACEYMQRTEMVQKRQGDGSWAPVPELGNIGITFDPISIRKIWLNYRLPVYDMDYQPCPFFFEQMPRFALNANIYDPMNCPMGYSNIDTIQRASYLFGTPEVASLETAYRTVYPKAEITLDQLVDPQFNTELKWTFHPMLPLQIVEQPAQQQQQADPNNPQAQQQAPQILFAWGGDKDIQLFVSGQEDMLPPQKEQDQQQAQTDPSITSPIVPLKRYIVETFGNNLVTGGQEIIRLQENFYPYNQIPIYGSAHMPSLDDGAYSPSIGTILEGSYIQICKSLDQIRINKDLNNDPPIDILQSSPSMSRKGINSPGSRNPVMGPNDISRRPPFDSNGTTLQFHQMIRDQAQTSSKSTDAILGKAMGSRTSATEANNVYSTAMSGVTTDTNLFSYDIFGNYAERVWLYTGRWVDPDILRLVTGTYGFVIQPEHLQIRFGLAWDVGSQFIESITRQNNIQYLLQACPPGDQTLNRAYLFEQLLTEWKFKNIDRIVNDGGQDEQIILATEQATQTYMGYPVMVDPDQDHNLAIKVKVSFLKDHDSVWNTDAQTAQRAPMLVKQIQMHQQFLLIQQQQQALAAQQQMLLNNPKATQPSDPTGLHPMQRLPSPGTSAATPGQARQQTGQ